MKKKMIIYNVTPINTDVTDLKEFERKVAQVAKLGATHVYVTEIPKSRWIWDLDRSDPYPNWGMLNSALFKIIVPQQLQRWLPVDYAKKNLELVKKRSAILRRYGLRAAAHFCEPFYLPEAVYREHPAWRGPRCDHPRRSKNYYYSPCMDNPEVLAMYRGAMKELCEVCDLDYVYLHTNDCGGGICWSSGLYDGANGPEHCKDIPLSQRILGYFRVFRQGAADAGRNISIETNSNIGFKADEHVMDAIWPILDDGLAVNFKTNKGTPLTTLVDVVYEYTFAPVRCIPTAVCFTEQLEKAFSQPSEAVRIWLYDEDFDESCRIIEEFNKKPTKGLADRIALLNRVAVSIAGKGGAQALLNAWAELERGKQHYLDTCIEGFSWTSVNQRLINRPFVLFPDELTPEQKDYYRAYQFQAVDERHADDLLDNQCTSFVRGPYAVFIASRCMQKALTRWESAAEQFRTAANLCGNGNAEKLTLLSQKVELLTCFARNYVHAMKFQDIVDSTDYSQQPEISPQWPLDADPRLLEFERLTRAEIDNTYRVIELIEKREREMLVLAPTVGQEDIFWLSPEITAQLRRKAEIMLDRQLDGKRLFRTNNK